MQFSKSFVFFVLSVYLPSEYLDLLWSLYDSLSTESLVVVMGDLNADMRNATGDKSACEPSWHGKKLLEFVHNFNLFPVNLFQNCIGPLDTFFQLVGVSIQPLTTFSYQIPGFKRLLMQKCFAYLDVDNTSDHVPIQVDIDLPFASVLPLGWKVQQFTHMKIKWNDCLSTEIDEKYVSPLIAELNELDFSDSTSIEELTRNLTKAIVRH